MPVDFKPCPEGCTPATEEQIAEWAMRAVLWRVVWRPAKSQKDAANHSGRDEHPPEPKQQAGAEQRIRELKAELTDLNRENGRLMYERNVEADQERAAAQHYMQIAEDAGVRIEELEAEVERLKEQIRTEVRRQKGAVEQ